MNRMDRLATRVIALEERVAALEAANRPGVQLPGDFVKRDGTHGTTYNPAYPCATCGGTGKVRIPDPEYQWPFFRQGPCPDCQEPR